MKISKSLAFPPLDRVEGGNVALIFAVASFSALTMVAAAVELGRTSRAKAALSAAADAGALAAKRQQKLNADLGDSLSRAAGSTAGIRTFMASAPGEKDGVSNVTSLVTWDQDGSARLTAKATQDLIFAKFFGFSTIDLSAVSVAAEGKAIKGGAGTTMELALVVDTTASMFEKDGRPSTRFTLMRSAAKDFVNSVFDEAAAPDRLRVAVIPWTTTVNIRGEVPAQTWDASAAPAQSPPDSGSRILPSALIDRGANVVESAPTLQNLFAPVNWRGCISGQGESLSTTDDAKLGMSWSALVVPPRVYEVTRTQMVTQTVMCNRYTGCSSPPSPPSSPPPPPPKAQGNWMAPRKKSETFAFLNFGKSTNNAACVNNPYPCTLKLCVGSSPEIRGLDCTQWDNFGTENAFFNFSGTRLCVNGGCKADLNTDLANGCVADYNEITWNNTGGAWCPFVQKLAWDSLRPITGPNLNCPMPMLGLSASRQQVIGAIDLLTPAPGGTHADVGLRWGLRVLSPRPEWAQFFQHKTPEPYDSPKTEKIMILMTDGANEQAINFPGYWGCNEAGAPRCNGSPDRANLDTRMQAWCTAIRDTYKIKLYTVAINVADSVAVNRLKQCAGDPERAFAVDASQIKQTLAKIAQDTAEPILGNSPDLRLKE